jgi:hypothetical protein
MAVRRIRQPQCGRAGDVRLVPTNEGIGPARIETFELWWDGKPMSSAVALIQACCLTTPVETKEAKALTLFTGPAAPRILRAGEHVDFYSMPSGPENTELWSKLNAEVLKITTRVCYCSVFDQCWVHVSGVGLLEQDPKKIIRPDRVDSCVAPAVPYQSE